ncbi:hypothetical protein EXIGLDRAFT_693938 [Exidia glandulosa HHB12029]|uniref:Uncharacterized protein n=1 Tax=Exidia glandulosa HHB12029 TaxID=1314781 RepID=A0A165GZ13_EXIGL|nr:hypothetical protein EXIGLDRAFT_693938 [Exidia glandulosa HHB12029]
MSQSSYAVDYAALQAEGQALHLTAWGRKWPVRSGAITKADIGDVQVSPVDDPMNIDESASVVDEDFTYGTATVEPAEKLEYQCFLDLEPFREAFQLKSLPTVLVVRDEYVKLYDALTEGSLHEERGVVILGQSGIGKTAFLLYILLRRLELGLPTAIQLRSTHYYLFDGNGCAVYQPDAIGVGLKRCWALADSNDIVNEPCTAFRGGAERIIQAALPDPDRWKTWMKYADGLRVVMELPTALEIGAILEEYRLDTSATFAHVRKWGPSIRIVLGLARRSGRHLSAYELQLESDAEKAGAEICKDPSLIRLGRGIFTSVGSAVLFIRPVRDVKDDPTDEIPMQFSSLAQCYIPTQYLSTFFEAARAKVSNEKSLELFAFFSSHSFTRIAAGWAHEQQMHSRLATSSTPLIIFRDNQRASMVPSSTLLPGTKAALKRAKASSSFYWIPSVVNFPGVDGVLVTVDGDEKNLYAVQATIAEEHPSPVKGLREVWKQVDKEIRQTCRWNFVVVADEESTATGYLRVFTEELQDVEFGRDKILVQKFCQHVVTVASFHGVKMSGLGAALPGRDEHAKVLDAGGTARVATQVKLE